MKITCSKNQFLYGVNTVSKAVSNKTTMDILQCILIEAYDDCIKLTANDTELGIETVIQGTIIEPGKIALEAKIFSEIIKKNDKGGFSCYFFSYINYQRLSINLLTYIKMKMMNHKEKNPRKTAKIVQQKNRTTKGNKK